MGDTVVCSTDMQITRFGINVARKMVRLLFSRIHQIFRHLIRHFLENQYGIWCRWYSYSMYYTHQSCGFTFNHHELTTIEHHDKLANAYMHVHLSAQMQRCNNGLQKCTLGSVENNTSCRRIIIYNIQIKHLQSIMQPL